MSRVNIDLDASICCPHLSAGPLIKVGSICVTFWALFLFFFFEKRNRTILRETEAAGYRADAFPPQPTQTQEFVTAYKHRKVTKSS